MRRASIQGQEVDVIQRSAYFCADHFMFIRESNILI